MIIWKRLMIKLAVICSVLLLISTIADISSYTEDQKDEPVIIYKVRDLTPANSKNENTTNNTNKQNGKNIHEKPAPTQLLPNIHKEVNLLNNNLEALCESEEVVIFPEAGITKDYEWRSIIQNLNINNTNFKQGIRVERCKDAGAKCKFDGIFPLGYATMCVQKYIYKKLVAIKDSKEIYYESFKLPSNCVCKYKITDISTRFNQNLTEASKTDN